MADFNLRLAAGQAVRIDGRRFIVGIVTDAGRIFTDKENGIDLHLANAAQIRMAREGRITSEAMWNALTEGVKEAVATDWDAFSPDERGVMQWRSKFVRKLMDKPKRDRRKMETIQAVIEEVFADNPDKRKKPKVRAVREWHVAFEAGGRDIRALADLSHRKGRGDQIATWIREEINKAIDQVYAVQPPGTLQDTRKRAVSLIRAGAEREGLSIPFTGQKDVVGVNVVSKVLATRDGYEILVRREGKAEADRLMTAVGGRPPGRIPAERSRDRPHAPRHHRRRRGDAGRLRPTLADGPDGPVLAVHFGLQPLLPTPPRGPR